MPWARMREVKICLPLPVSSDKQTRQEDEDKGCLDRLVKLER